MILEKWSWPFLLVVILSCVSCSKKENTSLTSTSNSFKTENLIVVVIDGPRYSETWGDPNHTYVPRLANELAADGIINTNFHNLGVTRTIPGHTAILTGEYEDIENSGDQFPSRPSFLQMWLDRTREAPSSAQIVTSKTKLGVLNNSTDLNWRNSFVPETDAVDRWDWLTYAYLIKHLQEEKPKLVFVNLSGPDSNGHDNDWDGYLSAITETDSLLAELKTFIDRDTNYAGKTSLIMTNDHGRHLDGIRNGFIDHGDQCVGCTHINFYAYGPDFKKGVILDSERELIDIAPTIAHLMGFDLNGTSGEIMHELFEE